MLVISSLEFKKVLISISHGRVFSGVPSLKLVFSELEFFKTTRDSSISTRQCIDVPSTGRVKGTSRVTLSFTRFYSTKGQVKYPSKIRVLKLCFLKTNLDSILDSTRLGIYEIADTSSDLAHGYLEDWVSLLPMAD